VLDGFINGLEFEHLLLAIILSFLILLFFALLSPTDIVDIAEIAELLDVSLTIAPLVLTG
jgi:hypothetical protein